MKKPFHINNYLNQRANEGPGRQPEASRLPMSRSEKLDYYEQYLEKHNLQHSNSALPQERPHSPFKRTTTAATEEFSYAPNTARQKDTPLRKDSQDTQKNLLTQRFYYERSVGQKSVVGAMQNSSQSSGGKSCKQWQYQLEININKLKDIKNYLENQIGLLQHLLDETSQGLPDIDLEFQKIRDKVMEYTARSLDAAFVKYKRQMIRWSKYEEVEKKSLQVVLEMRDYIKEGEKMLEEIRMGSSVANLTNSLKEVSNRVEHYQNTTNEVKRVREECLRKHPTLKEEKVLEFEKVLQELCCF